MNLPPRALTLDRSELTNALLFSCINPISSQTARSTPSAAPEFESDAKISTAPPAAVIAGLDRRQNWTPSSPLAVAIDSICILISAAFSRDRDASAQRQPSRRNGPTKYPKTSTATAALLPFLRATQFRDSVQPSASASVKNAARYGGSSSGEPAFGCPGGTINVDRAQSHNAADGSAGWSGQVMTTRFAAAFSSSRRF